MLIRQFRANKENELCLNFNVLNTLQDYARKLENGSITSGELAILETNLYIPWGVPPIISYTAFLAKGPMERAEYLTKTISKYITLIDEFDPPCKFIQIQGTEGLKLKITVKDEGSIPIVIGKSNCYQVEANISKIDASECSNIFKTSSDLFDPNDSTVLQGAVENRMSDAYMVITCYY